jgi:hypothetical protein
LSLLLFFPDLPRFLQSSSLFLHSFQQNPDAEKNTPREFLTFKTAAAQAKLDSREFQAGDLIDCKDTVEKWLLARVMEVKNNEVYVHFEGWDKVCAVFFGSPHAPFCNCRAFLLLVEMGRVDRQDFSSYCSSRYFHWWSMDW